MTLKRSAAQEKASAKARQKIERSQKEAAKRKQGEETAARMAVVAQSATSTSETEADLPPSSPVTPPPSSSPGDASPESSQGELASQQRLLVAGSLSPASSDLRNVPAAQDSDNATGGTLSSALPSSSLSEVPPLSMELASSPAVGPLILLPGETASDALERIQGAYGYPENDITRERARKAKKTQKQRESRMKAKELAKYRPRCEIEEQMAILESHAKARKQRKKQLRLRNEQRENKKADSEQALAEIAENAIIDVEDPLRKQRGATIVSMVGRKVIDLD